MMNKKTRTDKLYDTEIKEVYGTLQDLIDGEKIEIYCGAKDNYGDTALFKVNTIEIQGNNENNKKIIILKEQDAYLGHSDE